MSRKNNAVRRERMAGGGKHRAAAPSAPLALWRTMPADCFDGSNVANMREALSTIAMIDEPMWRAAAGGDAAAAVGLALRLDPQRATKTAFDLVMTALAACAVEGDATACLVMSYAMRRYPGAGRGEARIATSWLVRSFIGVLRKGRCWGGLS